MAFLNIRFGALEEILDEISENVDGTFSRRERRKIIVLVN